MKNYRPILLQNLAVAVPGVRVRQLRLNQHTPEAVWTPHAHDHGHGPLLWCPPGLHPEQGSDCDGETSSEGVWRSFRDPGPAGEDRVRWLRHPVEVHRQRSA